MKQIILFKNTERFKNFSSSVKEGFSVALLVENLPAM